MGACHALSCCVYDARTVEQVIIPMWGYTDKLVVHPVVPLGAEGDGEEGLWQWLGL